MTYTNTMHIFGTVAKSNQQLNCGERCKIDTPDTHIYDRSLSWLGKALQ